LLEGLKPEDFQPVLMSLARHLFLWAFVDSFWMLTSHEATMIQKELRDIPFQGICVE